MYIYYINSIFNDAQEKIRWLIFLNINSGYENNDSIVIPESEQILFLSSDELYNQVESQPLIITSDYNSILLPDVQQ